MRGWLCSLCNKRALADNAAIMDALGKCHLANAAFAQKENREIRSGIFCLAFP